MAAANTNKRNIIEDIEIMDFETWIDNIANEMPSSLYNEYKNTVDEIKQISMTCKPLQIEIPIQMTNQSTLLYPMLKDIDVKTQETTLAISKIQVNLTALANAMKNALEHMH